MTPQQFLQIAEVLPEPLLLLKADGPLLAANRAAKRLVGLPELGDTRHSLTELVLEPAEEVARYLRTCSRSRQLLLGALTLRSLTGESLVCRVEGAAVVPHQGDSDAVLLLRLIPKDHTIGQFQALNEQVAKLNRENRRRRETEEAMRRQKEWLQVTLESIGDAVIATDRVGKIVFMNGVAVQYLGWTEREATGRPLSEVFNILNEYSREPVASPVDEVIRRGAVVGLANHTVLIDRYGNERPIEDSAAPIKDGEGKLLGVILVFHDVTSQREAERELRKADRRKDEFLATLAHELRNPLAPIRNSLEIVKQSETTGNESVRSAYATMDRQLSQMVRLIDDLLDVSRISRGKLELRRERVEVIGILNQALETCRPLADRSGHQISVALPSAEVIVDGDHVRLTQVFSNLLNNACKFTPPGGRVAVTCVLRPAELEVSIRDSGVGIPPDHLQSIFEMFSQVDSSLERSQGGLGIGLTLVKQVLELHGGSVEARSLGKGHGSEFVVRLPLGVQAAFESEPAPSPSSTTAGGAYRILVVDDNRDSAMSLAMLLKLSGHSTQTAFDGAEALVVAENFRPQAILLDIGLPTMNGYEVCRAIRELPWGKQITIIALTGWGQQEDRRKSSEAGFSGHLVKPVELATLRSMLKDLLPK